MISTVSALPSSSQFEQDIAALQPTQLLQSLPSFWEKIEQLAKLIGLDISQLQADHIAMRINQLEVAQSVHKSWLKLGEQISTAIINGRPIIVIEFTQDLDVAGHTIECLELPYPSNKFYPVEGWEHVEFVLPSDAQTCDEFVTRVKAAFPILSENWSRLADMGVKVKLSSPKGEGERLANPTVAFKYQGVCIKLHPHSLKTIIASEQA